MICLICGNKIEYDTTFCPHCGARVEDANEDSLYQTFSELSIAEIPSPMIVTVILREKTGEVTKITDYPAVLGRSSHCDCIIEGNPTIGRKHLLINRIGDRIYFEDMGSLNHTYLNGTQMTEAIELVDTEIIRVSDEIFRLQKVVL